MYLLNFGSRRTRNVLDNIRQILYRSNVQYENKLIRNYRIKLSVKSKNVILNHFKSIVNQTHESVPRPESSL